MKIPRYWASTFTKVKGADGHIYDLKRWGCSVDNVMEARHQAAEKLRRAVEIVTTVGFQNQHYDHSYATAPRREELIETITDEHGELIGAITRNRYGALVLNTSRLLIADVDNTTSGLLAYFKSLFSPKAQRPAGTLAMLQQFQQAHPEYNLRIYQTHSGFRVMIVNQTFEPTAELTQRLFQALQCDPLYMTLCRAQDCFRARLTPKPWRCASPVPPNSFPRETAGAQNVFARWRVDYERRSRDYAVCERLGGVGQPQGAWSPAVTRLVELHDQYVLRPGLPLA